MIYMKQVAFFPLLLTGIEGIIFKLLPNSQKCLREEINKGVIVTGEYEFSEALNQRTHLAVTDSKGQVLLNREDTKKGKFAFTTEDFEVFEVCVISRVISGYQGTVQDISLKMKHGVEAKNYEKLGEAAKLKPLELELKRLEDLSSSVVQDFILMKKREEEMRSTNGKDWTAFGLVISLGFPETTNTRVLYFSIFTVCCLLCLATWQVLYLRRFFKAKKLID